MCYNQCLIVSVGDEVVKGEIFVDGFFMEFGEFVFGCNVMVGFMMWDGYNYEDVIIMSECLVKDDVYIFIYIEEYELEVCDMKFGFEEIICDILNVGEDVFCNFDDCGIICIGVEVKDGDFFVGKVMFKGVIELIVEECFFYVIFGEKVCEVCDIFFCVFYGGGGIIYDVKVFNCEDGDEFFSGVNQLVCVYIVQKCKIFEGDKMVGCYGNKGVIFKIFFEEDMFYFFDGILIDIMFNLLGVLLCMNIGQVLEFYMGMVVCYFGIYIVFFVFDGV